MEDMREDLPIRQFVVTNSKHLEMAKKHLGVEEIDCFLKINVLPGEVRDSTWCYKITISPVQITRKRLRAIVGGGVSNVVRGWT